jgi:type IV pilus assembly protein PilM
MNPKPTSSKAVGIHHNEGKLITASLSYRSRQISIDQLDTVDVKPLYIPDESIAVTGIETKDLLIRPLRVGLTKEVDIYSVLPFESESLFPFPASNGIVDGQILQTGEESTDLAVTGIEVDVMVDHLGEIKDWGIEPEVVSTIPAALAAFAGHFFPSQPTDPDSSVESVGIFHIGPTTSTVVLAQSGHAAAAKGIEFGADDLNGADDHSPFQMLFTQSYLALAKQAKEKEPPKRIIITGEEVSDEILNPLLASLQLIPLYPTEKNRFYAIPIGLALQALPQNMGQINLRKNEFTYPHPWKRSKKTLLTFFGAALLLALSVYIFGASWNAKSEDQAREGYLALLTALQRSPEQVELDYRKKVLNQKTPSAPATINLADEPIERIERWVEFLNQEIASSGESFPLFPNTPRVTDLMAWLSTHPNVVSINPETGKKESLLTIVSLNYTMVKRPEDTKRREKYQVRVDLEFKTDSARIAREFHDSILAPNALINTNEEVKWTTNKNVYRTTFILKDQTFYPG